MTNSNYYFKTPLFISGICRFLFLKRISDLFYVVVILCLLLLSACKSTQIIQYTADQFPQQLQKNVINTSVPVYTWQPRFPNSSNVLRIYIEGDGKAWVKRNRPSLDPTPRSRLVHSLMLNDSKQDIAYLARPCQYIQNQHCTTNLWTFDRYNQFSVDIINTAIDSIKENGGYKQIELVGYSGGATIALMAAATRSDVLLVRTIAGNLSPAYTNQLHMVSKMPSALDPVSYSAQLATIPQIHFYGTEDRVIPASVSKNYLDHFDTTQCISVFAVNADHRQGWSTQWQTLLNQTPKCMNSQQKQQTQKNPQ